MTIMNNVQAKVKRSCEVHSTNVIPITALSAA